MPTIIRLYNAVTLLDYKTRTFPRGEAMDMAERWVQSTPGATYAEVECNGKVYRMVNFVRFEEGMDAGLYDCDWEKVEVPAAPVPAEKAIQVVTLTNTPKVGIFIYSVSVNTEFPGTNAGWYVAVEIGNCRSYLQGPFRTQEEAVLDARRVSPMYPGLNLYHIVIPG